MSVVVTMDLTARASGGQGGHCGGKNKSCDVVAPTVSITVPAPFATVAGTTLVEGTAADNDRVKQVSVRVDSGSPAVASGTSSWAYSLATTAFADGTHVITAIAGDMAGNVGSSSVTVTVQNAAIVPSPSPSPSSSPSASPSPSPSPSAFPSPTGTPSSSAGWLLVCDYSHSLMDDPVVFPGVPDASHLHDFFANTSVNAFSTYGSMTDATTTCSATSGDSSGYWAPALYQDGVKIDPAGVSVAGRSTREQFYYRKNNLADGTVIQTIPPDLRVIAGNSHAMSEADNPKLGSEIYWGCSDNSTSGKLKAPPASCTTGIITLHIGFPNCWDGVNLDTVRPDGSPASNPVTGRVYPNDHRSHMAYPSSGVCPADHPVPLPRVISRIEYPVGTTTGTITLSSGPTYTAHGDFWNTWNQSRLEQLIADCLNAGLNCGKI
jgi:hypothetical protein